MNEPSAITVIAEIVYENLVISGYAPDLDEDQIKPLADAIDATLRRAGVMRDEAAGSMYYADSAVGR